MMAVMTAMPKYRCHKEVWALKIQGIRLLHDEAGNLTGIVIVPADRGFAEIRMDAEYFTKHRPQPGGYYVVYADGYKSFSPAQAFEEGYTLIK